MHKCAILMPNWVGDLVMALSVIERKRQTSGDSFLLIVNPKLTELTERLTDLPVIPYKRDSKDSLKQTIALVKKQDCDALYVLPMSFSSGWFAFQTGIKRRRGIRGEMRALLLSERLPLTTRNRDLHITKEYATVLEAQYTDPATWIGNPLKADPRYRARIVLCPGANYGAAKRWNNFPELTKLLSDHEIVILGGDDAIEDARKIENAAKERVVNLAGKTSLAEAAKIISGARVVVSNDSGLMHLAGFLGRPVVGIFGSTSPVWTKPVGGTVRIAQKVVPCAPCFKRECENGNYDCLQSISADRVYELVVDVMETDEAL